MFKGFEWVYKLLVWTKGFQMAVVEWKTSVKFVLTVYSRPGLFKIAIYYSYSYYQYCPTIKMYNFIDMFKGFEWTKCFQMVVAEWKTSVK